jgi:hypothetical protein
VRHDHDGAHDDHDHLHDDDDDWMYVRLWRHDNHEPVRDHVTPGDDDSAYHDHDGRGRNHHRCHDDDCAVHPAGEAREEAGKAGPQAGLHPSGEADAAGVHAVARGTEERKR